MASSSGAGDILSSVLKSAGIAADGFRHAMQKRGIDDQQVLDAINQLSGSTNSSDLVNNPGGILALRGLYLSEKSNPERAVKILQHVNIAASPDVKPLGKITSGSITANAALRATEHYTGVGKAKGIGILGKFGVGALKFDQTENSFLGMKWPKLSRRTDEQLIKPGVMTTQNLLESISSGKRPEHLAELLGVQPETMKEITKALHNSSLREGENLTALIKDLNQENPAAGEVLAKHFERASQINENTPPSTPAQNNKIAFANSPSVNLGAAAVSASLAVWVMKSMNTRKSGEPQMDENGKMVEPPPSRWKQAAKFLTVSGLMGVSAVAAGRAALMPNQKGFSWVERVTLPTANQTVQR